MDYYFFYGDPRLLETAKYICILYLEPHEDRVLLSYDERTAMQAKKLCKILTMRKGYPEKYDFHYKRHGRGAIYLQYLILKLGRCLVKPIVVTVNMSLLIF